jgi:3-methyladenine DNA glycosylase AlkD
MAGVLVLAERLLPELTVADIDRLARPFAAGWIDDWSTCDWYCVKLLGPLVARSADPQPAAEAIAEWRLAERLWQRRAAAVSFVGLAPRGDDVYPGFVELLLTVCTANADDPARFSQTSVGWLLRELFRAEPERVERFVREHGDHMSAEARRAALARLRPRAAKRT